MSGAFVWGSRSSGNSVSTSAISLPRSPQPMYTTICVSDHFASCCCATVFPEPKGPGIAAVPPFATGKSASRIRCPVTRGVSGINFSTDGLDTRTGHSCMSLSSVPSLRVQITSSTVCSPDAIVFIVPPFSGGTMILCCKCGVSCT